jgi:hypothetical protein
MLIFVGYADTIHVKRSSPKIHGKDGKRGRGQSLPRPLFQQLLL